jgi:hypothetical protein
MDWICNECGKKMERLQICWGVCDGQFITICFYYQYKLIPWLSVGIVNKYTYL